jgi:hypothetical protein
MPLSVSDRGSNKPELIEHAAEVLGRSTPKVAVFKAIYTGKKSIKSVVDLMNGLGMPRITVLDAGRALADEDIVEQVKVGGLTGYKKIAFFQRHKKKILRFASDSRAREKLITKRRPSSHTDTRSLITVSVRVPKRGTAAKLITIDDVVSFNKVQKLSGTAGYVSMPETRFKAGVARILGEKGSFKDWGGESRDLSSTRLKIGGRRRMAAFAFKGPGQKGRLTPGKMGKNGDQIQRLVRCPADVFFIQYWAEIDDSVVEQLRSFAELRSYFEQREIFFGVIDGVDSERLIRAYSNCFRKQ